MALWNLISKRKPTGGKLSRVRKKRKLDRGSEFLETKIGQRKSKTMRMRSGNKKTKLLSVKNINIADKGKIRAVEIISVEENKANPHYIRRNIITKGAVVKTEAGLVKVTSRPGQEGILNGRLITAGK
jgi:small subunit ribosomal protein S8e